jgi:hypothetical protein
MQGALAAMQGAGMGLEGVRAQLAGTAQGMEGARAAMQGAGMGLEGVRTQLAGTAQGMQGAQAAMQGAGMGLEGTRTQLAGTAQGMEGARTGLAGVTSAQAGYDLLGRSGVNLANIGALQQQADLARMGFQQNVGAQQQALEQAKIDQAVKQYYQAREYPMQQMAQYNALLHGYYAPNETVNYYQNISPVSQATGLLTAASQLGNLGRKAGGKIKETGGIDDLMIRKTLKKARR